MLGDRSRGAGSQPQTRAVRGPGPADPWRPLPNSSRRRCGTHGLGLSSDRNRVGGADGLLKSAFRLWDSPVVLALVWVSAVISTVAVLSQQQQLLQASSAGCGTAAVPDSAYRGSAGVPGSTGGGLLGGGAGSADAAAAGTASEVSAALAALEPWASPQARHTALLALQRMGGNLLAHPGEPKYARIWKANSAFVKALGSLHGHDAAVRAFGFRDDVEAEAWQFVDQVANRQHLEAAMSVLQRAISDLPQG
mmetsp:Transcript_11642/g.37248  ORF Transcript_11642/g.37248 Transcript_11642/m.37248 type:complete len:251 (+) Transcript_11642:120-872(+)